MDTTKVHLHGGPLDGAVRPAPADPDGTPAERAQFEHQVDGAVWYVEYRRARHTENGWHFEATGNEERADEE
jgi:hypothetical protein